MNEPSRIDVAIVSNVPTPYRLHVLRRVANELPQVKLHSLFTHTDSGAGMPWDMRLEGEINAVSFGDDALRPGEAVSRRATRLFRRVRQYLVDHHVRFIILLGYNDLTRSRLIHWARANHVPLLVTGDSNIHGERRLSPMKRAIKRAVLSRVLAPVAGLMPMGSAGRAFFTQYVDENTPMFLFPYEPDYAQLHRRDKNAEREFRQKHGLADGRRRLLYCGRLVGVKRVDVLIDAFARIAQDRPEWDLVIAGDGPLKSELIARVPAALRDRVKWLGFLQTDDTIRCYHSCDVLVLPSDYEPWALVINEAVATGMAVVATNVVGAALELVRDGVNGRLVAPSDVDAMSAALLDVTTPEKCAAMRSAAPAMLAQWRAAADPVEGVRQAIKHFQLIS